MSHWKTHLLDESEGGLFRKLTECRLNLSGGHRIRDCVWSRSLQRDSFSPDLPVVSEYKFEKCLLYPQASKILKILRCFYWSWPAWLIFEWEVCQRMVEHIAGFWRFREEIRCKWCCQKCSSSNLLQWVQTYYSQASLCNDSCHQYSLEIPEPYTVYRARI